MSPLIALETCGRVLYRTAGWRARIADDLVRPGAEERGISVRSIGSWYAGERGVPRWLSGACIRLLRERAAELETLADILENDC